MILKGLKIEELKKIIIKNMRKFDKKGYAKSCIVQLKNSMPIFKDFEKAEKAKSEGNRLYAQKNSTFTQFYEILVLFNKSIAFAPKDSEELACAYANKSAVLLRMRKYNECISEIDKVLKITESMTLKIKMLCRKAECFTALGSPDNRGCLEKAKFIIAKLEDTKGMTNNLNKLIEKTQSILDKGKLDIPKEDKRVTQALEMIEEAEKRDISESIRVEDSEIYGRHLVAARDYKPGEIILSERPYLNSLDDSKAFHYCDHCCNHLWTAVPCDHCSRRLYCSDDCKSQAWNDYHEMECYVLACMRIPFDSKWNGFIPFVVSFFCKAFKEAGGIEQLVADSKTFHKYEDPSDKDVPSSPSFTSYKRILTLPTDLKHTKLKVCTEISIIALMGLAKYTKIFGKTYHFVNMKQLMNDDTAILVGALLLKFSLLIGDGLIKIPFVDPNKRNEDLEEFSNGPEHRSQGEHLIFDCSLPMLIAHTVYGCLPNVQGHATHGNRIILCAIQPIKAGDRLVKYRYHLSSVWRLTPKSERQLDYSGTYGHLCECRACTEDWPVLTDDLQLCWELYMDESHCPSTAKLWDELNAITLDWTANCHRPSYPDIKMFFRTKDLVTLACKRLLMPSPLIIKSVLLLTNMIQAFYDRSEIYARMPQLRPRKIGPYLDHSVFCSCESEETVELKSVDDVSSLENVHGLDCDSMTHEINNSHSV